MAKKFTVISENKTITAKVGEKTTLINTSRNDIFLTDEATYNALSGLGIVEKQSVLNALYKVAPGHPEKISAGTYNIIFASEFGQSAVLLVENNS